MDRYLIVYRGVPVGSADGPAHDRARWRAWLDGLGAALVDRGALAGGAVEMPSRLLGPKESTSSLSGYAIVRAADFNAAVALAASCPVFDEGGSVEVARLDDSLA
ncbi:hypothetical protein [uncultured Massilia sp.]|uniref:hypothetical protein n=1 Tax=uncultured Massilia sp. TaxID=169973 RepID=UPI0025D88E23|nr:hypothetical protein [uncultured Massilia sp.]